MQLFSITVPFAAKTVKAPAHSVRSTETKAPRVLDQQALKLVSGGDGTPVVGPRKVW